MQSPPDSLKFVESVSLFRSFSCVCSAMTLTRRESLHDGLRIAQKKRQETEL
jgi:hypothetical protein